VKKKEVNMSDSVYKVIELIGTSTKSWEDAARVAIEKATKTLDELRVAEVVEQDVKIEDGKVIIFRTKLRISFRYIDQ
jgi:flavin-binding protein dodecin